MMDEEVAREGADTEFEKKRDEQRRKDSEKTEKNRKKREKSKARKGNKPGKQNDETIMEVEKAGEIDEEPNANRDNRNLLEQHPGLKDNGEAEGLAGIEEVGVIIHDDD